MRLAIPIVTLLCGLSVRGDRCQYKLITFDLFAALVDLKASLYRSAGEILGEEIDNATKTNIVTAWISSYSTLKDINSLARVPGMVFNLEKYNTTERFVFMLYETLDAALRQHDLPLSVTTRTRLVQSFGDLSPLPGVTKVLVELSKSNNYKLAILSNGDNDTLTRAVKVFEDAGVVFHYILGSSVPQVFKPEHAMYEQALKLGFESTEILHVAGADFDAIGARVSGIDSVWHNFAGKSTLINISGQKCYEPLFQMTSFEQIHSFLDSCVSSAN
mmetsp:Transcript_7136/g.11343  ORF Transcript_7136/g.11343 Transcript_7136/m.11343 type:complete len:274 (+) Transcript_7136:1143-1964(+)|eukprot:CAMPEP_0203764662 /NCGR_PEP_ID=MMETSP0098-20131031/17967_1 /ASSEMBLY_ACC=CAM_ASM_000208 /TAXON_ID=96639 /ORGANISM=" , Strain NY0313808BC1" /LENGTH=273 /DNA_ID=CAMNT_0050660805 /DNA_START=1090 /DNA_END=1911 /DNA_ORIENTATION=-